MEKQDTAIYLPDPLKIEDLDELWPEINKLKEVWDAAQRKGTCLEFENFLNLNPDLTKVHMQAVHEPDDGDGSYIYLIVSPEFDEEGSKDSAHLYGEDHEELCNQIRSIFHGFEEEVSRVFVGEKMLTVQDATIEIGKALLGKGYKPWMSRREAAALDQAVPLTGRSGAAPRM